VAQLSKTEFAEWLEHPVTKLVRGVLRERIEEIKDDWLSGVFTAENEFGTKFLNGQANGAAKALQQVLELSEEDINGEENVSSS